MSSTATATRTISVPFTAAEKKRIEAVATERGTDFDTAVDFLARLGFRAIEEKQKGSGASRKPAKKTRRAISMPLKMFASLEECAAYISEFVCEMDPIGNSLTGLVANEIGIAAEALAAGKKYNFEGLQLDASRLELASKERNIPQLAELADLIRDSIERLN